MKAYKGFNKDMTCRGFQYEEGQTYEMDGDPEVCKRGFHACENPFDVLDHYPIFDNEGRQNRFCEVSQSGKMDCERNGAGDGAKIGSSGDDAQIESTGDNAVVMAAGMNSIAAAGRGSWITLAEWGHQDGRVVPVCVKTRRVDGKRIKAGVFYRLCNGKFVEAEQEGEKK